MFLANLYKNTRTRIQLAINNGANWKDMNHFLSQYNTEFIWLYLKTALNSAYVPRVSVKEYNQPRYSSTLKFDTKSSTFKTTIAIAIEIWLY